jgi:hypothetical protein
LVDLVEPLPNEKPEHLASGKALTLRRLVEASYQKDCW